MTNKNTTRSQKVALNITRSTYSFPFNLQHICISNQSCVAGAIGASTMSASRHGVSVTLVSLITYHISVQVTSQLSLTIVQPRPHILSLQVSANPINCPYSFSCGRVVKSHISH